MPTTSKRLLRRLLACAGAAETMPSHGPQRKSPDLLQFSSCLHAKERNNQYAICRSPRQTERYPLPIVRKALNAISDQNKTET